MGRLEVTTVSGDITLQQVDASGNVHVESSSGDIKVQLTVRLWPSCDSRCKCGGDTLMLFPGECAGLSRQSLSFTGMYFMRSERGSMTIRKGKYAGDVLTELSVRFAHVL